MRTIQLLYVISKEAPLNYIITVLILTVSISVQAKDGNDLLADCQKVVDGKNGVLLSEDGKLRAASCISYLSGFGGADAISPLTHKGKRMFCIPKSVSLKDAAEKTVTWMLNNREKLSYPRHQVLAMANIVNFPCNV